MNFTEVSFTCYPATDLAASRAFYEGILGLTPTMNHPTEDGGGWIEYELGAHTFSIGKMEGFLPSANGPSAGLEAVDFDAMIEKLKQAGVKFQMEPFDTPVCRMAMVFDPAGNILIIHKRKPGHS